MEGTAGSLVSYYLFLALDIPQEYFSLFQLSFLLASFSIHLAISKNVNKPSYPYLKYPHIQLYYPNFSF